MTKQYIRWHLQWLLLALTIVATSNTDHGILQMPLKRELLVAFLDVITSICNNWRRNFNQHRSQRHFALLPIRIVPAFTNAGKSLNKCGQKFLLLYGDHGHCFQNMQKCRVSYYYFFFWGVIWFLCAYFIGLYVLPYPRHELSPGKKKLVSHFMLWERTTPFCEFLTNKHCICCFPMYRWKMVLLCINTKRHYRYLLCKKESN